MEARDDEASSDDKPTSGTSVPNERIGLSVSKLKLDPENPRLPEDLLGKSQSDMLIWLEETANLEELASSMVENGFFEHEPLIVKWDEQDKIFIVVEGNRRFATIQILLQLDSAQSAELEFDFDTQPAKESLEKLKTVPCVVVSSDEAVRKFLGYRHIGGVKTWAPEAKARYLEEEVKRAAQSGSANPFKEVGKRVGTNALGVRGPFLALSTLKVARDSLGLASVAKQVLRNRFGVWNRLLNSSEVRTFIGLDDETDYGSVMKSLERLNKKNLSIVLDDMVPAPGTKIAVLQDSRDITRYGKVLAHPQARDALMTYRDLDVAAEVAEESSLPQRLRDVKRTIDLLIQNINNFTIEGEDIEASAALFGSARSLNAIVKDRAIEQD